MPFTREEILRVAETAKQKRSRVVLAQKNLSGLNLSEYAFSHSITAESESGPYEREMPASFKGSRLIKTNFAGCNLTGAKFRDAIAPLANFDRAAIDKARFIHTVLDYVDFSFVHGSSLEGVHFERASLRGSKFRGLRLARCVFDHADISYTDFTGARFIDCSFKNSPFHQTRMGKPVRCFFNNTPLDYSQSTTGLPISNAMLKEVYPHFFSRVLHVSSSNLDGLLPKLLSEKDRTYFCIERIAGERIISLIIDLTLMQRTAQKVLDTLGRAHPLRQIFERLAENPKGIHSLSLEMLEGFCNYRPKWAGYKEDPIKTFIQNYKELLAYKRRQRLIARCLGFDSDEFDSMFSDDEKKKPKPASLIVEYEFPPPLQLN